MYELERRQSKSYSRAYRSNQGGLVKIIVLGIIALLVLSYYQVDLRSLVQSETWQSNWAYIKEITVQVWNDYIVPLIQKFKN